MRRSSSKTIRTQRKRNPMLHATLPLLFESSDNSSVVEDAANADWVAIINAIDGPAFDVLVRRYYQALYHFRSQRERPALRGAIEVVAQDRQQALVGMLEVIEERKARRKREGDGDAADLFVDATPDKTDSTLPPSLRDFSCSPPLLSTILGGAGRPPCDALCLLRAFIAAPVLGLEDNPTAVYRLLRSNPTFAHLCGFLGRDVKKESYGLTSRQLPSMSTCEQFNEVMTRYGLWQLARLDQVRDNLASGVVEIEDAVSFDTTHVIANSHCANVVPPEAETTDGKKPKHRKVPRVHKRCGCDRKDWDTCEHPWRPTDPGAAVVVKGYSRIYWAHKVSVMGFADSEIPLDVRTLLYAADHDGKTLLPHLELLDRDLPAAIARLHYILADDAYQENKAAIPMLIAGARLLVPVHPRHVSTALATSFAGIDRFTAIGVPICHGGHRFDFRGRDLLQERYIWAAPNDADGRSVCIGCPFAQTCTDSKRRSIRVHRAALPQIDWDHPQHFAANRALYAKRTGIERAIKRIKIDLRGAHLTHRDAIRVQAHLDRKLLALHLLLAVKAQT
jgi:hypothetical protein